MPPDIVEYGLVGIALLVIYGIVDKAIVPMVKAQFDGKNGSPNGKWSHQEYVNAAHARRIDRHDSDIQEIRGVVEEVRRSGDVMQAILTRIEEAVKG